MNIEDYKKWKDNDDDVFFIPELYFSGTDIELQINNKKLIDVSNIMFSLRQNLKPVYGYKSYTYNVMAVGNRIIVGEFLIPFLSKNYLLNFFGKVEKTNKRDVENSNIGIPNEKTIEYLKRRGISNSVEITENGADDRINMHGYDSFDMLEDDRRRLLEYGFDISINYHTRTTQQIVEIYEEAEFSDANSVDSILRKGIETIIGVHLRGHSKTITINDTIYEKYEFIAKDIL